VGYGSYHGAVTLGPVRQEPAADSTAVAAASRTRSARFEPTALDRLLGRVQRANPNLARTSDLVLVGVTALLAVVDLALWGSGRAVDTGRLPMSIAVLIPGLGALAAVAVAVRRRYAVAALVTLAGASIALTLVSWAVGTSLVPSFAALFALAVLATGVLRFSPGGMAALLALLAAVAVAAEALRPRGSVAVDLLVLCEGAFAVAVVAGVYLRWSDWRRVAAEEAARTDERLEIARELHDLVGHYVTGIVVQAQAARHVAERRPTAAAAALESIEVAGIEAMAAMRRMVGGLRDDSVPAPGGNWDDIDQLLADAITRGAPVRAMIDPDVRGTALALVPSVHRIIGECLTNVRRHGRDVTCIDVSVRCRADRLLVTVHDDGVALSAPGHDTFGIVGMRERATALGGSLIAGPASDGGWLVRAELPIEGVR